MNREHHIEKDLKGNYLWINREGNYGEKYEENVLHKEKIRGIVPFYEIENMGEFYLVYAMEYRKNFLQKLEGGRIGCAQMESLIRTLVQIMFTVDEYLLDPSNLVLEMEHIYEEKDGWVCVYIPGYQQEFWRQMEKLSEDWLNYVDYGDEKAVLWAYTFYEKVHGYGCSMEELEKILKLEKKDIVYIESESDSNEIQIENEVVPVEKKSSFFRLFRKRQKRNKQKKEMEVSEFFRKENSLEETCPMIELTTGFEITTSKILTFIPMGDTNVEVRRVENIPALIGRASDEVDIWIEDTKISRIHARVDYNHGKIAIVDMNSVNGTFRNGERLKAGELYDLHAGDIIKLADLEFICQWCA